MKIHNYSKKIFIVLIITSLFIPLFVRAETGSLQLRDLSIAKIETQNLEADKYLGWRGTLKQFTENISLALTFNSFKKAEKKLVYAENRIRAGQGLLQKADKKSQEEAIKIISQANSYKYDTFLNNTDNLSNLWKSNDDKMDKLIRDLSAHQINKAIVWSQVEKVIPISSLSNLNILRNKTEVKDLNIIDKMKKSLDKLENKEALSLELDKTAIIIDSFQGSRENFISTNKNLLQKINNYQDKDIESFLKQSLVDLETERKGMYNEIIHYDLSDIKQLEIKEELRSQINKLSPLRASSSEVSAHLEPVDISDRSETNQDNHLEDFKNTPEYQKFLSNIDSSRQLIDENKQEK